MVDVVNRTTGTRARVGDLSRLGSEWVEVSKVAERAPREVPPADGEHVVGESKKPVRKSRKS